MIKLRLLRWGDYPGLLRVGGHVITSILISEGGMQENQSEKEMLLMAT